MTNLPIPPAENEYRFDRDRRWRFDFAWPDLKVAVEAQGAIYASGRHSRGKGQESDHEKLNEAQIAGWIVLLVSANQIADGSAEDWIMRAIDGRTACQAG